MRKSLLTLFLLLTISTLTACGKSNETLADNGVKIDATDSKSAVSDTNVSDANVAESTSDNDAEIEIEEPKPEISVVISDVVETVEENHYTVDYRDIMDDENWLENNFIKIENAGSNTVTTIINKLEYGVNLDGTPQITEITDPNDIVTGTYEILVTVGEGIDSVEQSILVDITGFVPGVLTYEDFEVVDYRNTGFHNLVDYFTDYPNGTGSTFRDCGILVFYKADEADLLGEEALAYRTPRGIGLGDSIEDVLRVYGDTEVKNSEDLGFDYEIDGLRATSFVIYEYPIPSGACLRIDFDFDQNGKVMCITMAAIYQICYQ